MNKKFSLHQLNFVAATLLVCGLANSASADDEGAAKAKLKNAISKAIAPGDCLPVPSKSTGDADLTISLGTVGTAQLSACLNGVVSACWTIDPSNGTVAKQANAFVRGVSFKVDHHCNMGYCKAGEKPATISERSRPDIGAFSTSGKAVAFLAVDGPDTSVGDYQKVLVFDAASKKLLKEFSVDADDSHPQGMQNMPSNIFFVGTSIFVRGDDAGPFSGIWQFGMDGKMVGRVGGTVYAGSVELADDKTLVIRDAGLIETRVDGSTGIATDVKLPKPNVCSQDQFELVENLLNVPDQDSKKKLAKCMKAVLRDSSKMFKQQGWTFNGVGYKLNFKSGWKHDQPVYDKQYTLLSFDVTTGKVSTPIKIKACKLSAAE
jgi:hypothetical protein